MASATPTSAEAPSPGRVLVIDDDCHICSVFRRVLERRGHTVLEAPDGHQGLTTAGEATPDIILLDLNLPVMGGLETLGKLSQQCPDIPVVIVSGSGSMKDAIDSLKLGAWDYLIKPLPDNSVLIRTVEANLERSRLIRQNKKIRQELDQRHDQIREDEEAGRKIQAKLFPPQDWAVSRYRFKHRVLPSLVLSGDFVDYFALGEHYAAFYCADVSGHGVSSALVTVLLKSLIGKYRERFQERHDSIILEPDRLLAQLNKELLQEELGKHLTLFYGVIDTNANTLRYASGGQHPPALLFSPEGLRILEIEGMAVGLFPFAAFKSDTVALPPVFRLMVFSDGALDALPLPTADAKLTFLQNLTTWEALRKFVDEAGANEHLPDDFTVLSVFSGEMP
jgi:serine phosphatase RsbU (regulator of sigma subunit)